MIEQIQRKSQVRESTLQKAPRTRVGATKKDKKADLKTNQTRRRYPHQTSMFFLIPLTTRQARDAKSPKWKRSDWRPAAQQDDPPRRSGRRSGRAQGGNWRPKPKHRKPSPSGVSSHHPATEKRRQQNNDHGETPRVACPPPRLARRSISGNGALVA